MKHLYISDEHINHDTIRRYTARPHADLQAMDLDILSSIREAEASGRKTYHLGDSFWKPKHCLQVYGGFARPELHELISGNHDRTAPEEPELRRAYYAWFGHITGTQKSWRENHLVVEDEMEGRAVRLLLSHAPQRDLRGCEFNLHGHVHTTPLREPARFYQEFPFVAEDPARYVNVSVELTGYRPRTLAELLSIPETRAGWNG